MTNDLYMYPETSGVTQPSAVIPHAIPAFRTDCRDYYEAAENGKGEKVEATKRRLMLANIEGQNALEEHILQVQRDMYASDTRENAGGEDGGEDRQGTDDEERFYDGLACTLLRIQGLLGICVTLKVRHAPIARMASAAVRQVVSLYKYTHTHTHTHTHIHTYTHTHTHTGSTAVVGRPCSRSPRPLQRPSANGCCELLRCSPLCIPSSCEQER
jgi:hypothetical protein